MNKLDRKALYNALALLDAIKAEYVIDCGGETYVNAPKAVAPAEPAPKKVPKKVPREHLYMSYILNLPVAGRAVVPAQTEVSNVHLQGIVSSRLARLYGRRACSTTLRPDGSIQVMRMR